MGRGVLSSEPQGQSEPFLHGNEKVLCLVTLLLFVVSTAWQHSGRNLDG